MCLLASLRVPPPDKDSVLSQDRNSRNVIDKWHTAACTRLSIVGKDSVVITVLKYQVHEVYTLCIYVYFTL